MVSRAALAAAFLIGLSLVPLTAAATSLTPDQQLVAGLRDATSANRAALQKLLKPSPTRATRASADVLRALAALDKATKASARAVGALETPSVRNGLRNAVSLDKRARADIGKGRYAAARTKLTRAMKLKATALEDFGVPLEKEFASYAVWQDMSEVPGFSNFSGLTATVGTGVTEIVIGAADRVTANAGEPLGYSAIPSDQLAIRRISQFTMTDPNGAFLGGWCSLDEGLISCPLTQPMRSDQRFTIAFGPKLPRGTKVLVKFRATNGNRSYAIVSMR